MQIIVCLPAGRGAARLNSRISNRIRIRYPIRKVDNIRDACADWLSAIGAHCPERINLFICWLTRLTREDEKTAIRRKFKDAPVEVTGGDERGAIGRGCVNDPGIAAREISKFTG